MSEVIAHRKFHIIVNYSRLLYQQAKTSFLTAVSNVKYCQKSIGIGIGIDNNYYISAKVLLLALTIVFTSIV